MRSVASPTRRSGPEWGPATTYRSSPKLRRAPAPPPAPTPVPRGRQAPPPASRGQRPAPQGQRPPSPGQRPPSARPPGRPPGPPPRPPSALGRPRRRLRPGALAALLVLVLAAYPLLLGAVGYLSLARVGELPESALPDAPGHTVLLVGSDSRAGLTEDQEVQLATGSGDEITGTRTDTIMLLHRPSSGGPTVLLSIPRDSWVEVPDLGQESSGPAKVNAAYAWGGAPLLTATVEQATGVRVDAYAETGLAGFAGLVDAVGGVEMCPENAIVDPKAGLDVPAGCQVMDGATALGYARSRDSAVGGDLGRATRQRELIAAIAGEAASPLTLANPFTALPLARAAGGALSVDDATGPVDLGRFALAFRSVASGSALSLTVPVADASRRTGGQLVVDWDAEQAEAVFEALRTGETESLRPLADAQRLPG